MISIAYGTSDVLDAVRGVCAGAIRLSFYLLSDVWLLTYRSIDHWYVGFSRTPGQNTLATVCRPTKRQLRNSMNRVSTSVKKTNAR